MTFLVTSTIFYYDEPNLISGVRSGISIGVSLAVLDAKDSGDQLWLLTEGGWVLARYGQWFGRLS